MEPKTKEVKDTPSENSTRKKQIMKTIQGKWPKNDLRRAFVEGAKWWEYVTQNSTMWPSDVDFAEQEAERRYSTATKNE